MPPTALLDALAARIQRVANQPVTAADFELERVPAAPAGSRSASSTSAAAPVGSDRDLAALQQRARRPRPRLGREVAEPGASSERPAPNRPGPERRPAHRPASGSPSRLHASAPA